MRMSRALAVVSLLVPGAVAGVAAAGPAEAGLFAPRWCSDVAPPCLVSATLGSGAVTKTDPNWEIDLTSTAGDSSDHYVQWMVVDQSGANDLATSQTWELVFDLGSGIKPRYTEAYAGRPDVVRDLDPTGGYHLTYTAKPVLTTDACDFDADWPWPCKDQAADDEWKVQLSGEIHDRAAEGDAGSFSGFDWAQSVDGSNGVFLETAGDGSRYLSSEMVNSRTYDADPTAGVDARTFKGEARFRMPYQMLRDDFGVPDPSTMVASSLTGTVNGGSATFGVVNDTTGKALVVDVSDITFPSGTLKQMLRAEPRRVLKVKTGTIVPTKPTQVAATRTAPGRGFVDFDPSKPRGAKVTGYAGKCVVVGGSHTVTATADNIVKFTGLKSGKAYDCKVRAKSKVGPGPWSAVVRMSRTPVSPG